MPRFGLDRSSSPDEAAAVNPYYSSSPSTNAAATGDFNSATSTFRSNRSTDGPQAQQQHQHQQQRHPILSCLSPDGRSVHVVHGSSIETHALPLSGTSEDAAHVVTVPVISTPLPVGIINPTDIMELVCLEGDTMPPSEADRHGVIMTMLPLLCIYTRYAVYSLQIGYPADDMHLEQPQIIGTVVEWTQPMALHMGSSQSYTILRVRPAPHRRLGYATFCPRGSLAALVVSSNGSGGNEYSLLIYHAKSKTVTTPLIFRTEAVLEEENVCDFSFAQSNAQSLFATLSIHLLKTNGNVFGASPIVFDGAMIPKVQYTEARDLIREYHHNAVNGAKARQYAAVLHFLEEAFDVQGNDYLVVRLHGGDANRSTLWPVQVQGPVLSVASGSNTAATCCEPYFCRNLCGLAVAGPGGVQISVMPPTSVLPIFAFATDDDACQVSDQQVPGILVEHISDLPCFHIVRDPVVETMLHLITEKGVTTLISHALRHISTVLHNSDPPPPQNPTKAWMAVDLPEQIFVQGAAVSGDAHLGHVLIVYLSTGQLTAVNLTQTQVRYESALAVVAPQVRQKDEAFENMEATLAFHEQLGPVVEKLEAGLLGMQKVVGTSTHPKDLDAGLLAAALSVKGRCEQDVILHLKYLAKLKALRLSELKKVIKGQVAQLQAIQESLKAVKSKNSVVRDQMTTLETKSKLLSKRSSTLLQASKDLRPSLTSADLQFFGTLQRMQAQCAVWEDTVGQLQYAAQTISMKSNVALPVLSPLEAADVRTLLRGQKDAIDQTQDRIQDTESLVAELVRETGGAVMASDSYGRQ